MVCRPGRIGGRSCGSNSAHTTTQFPGIGGSVSAGSGGSNRWTLTRLAPRHRLKVSLMCDYMGDPRTLKAIVIDRDT
jgi:hypothetical protein